jgi:hypothetical protein
MMQPRRAKTNAPAHEATCTDLFEEFIYDSNDRVAPWDLAKNSSPAEGSTRNIFCELPADVIVPLFVNNKIAFNKSIRYLQKVHDYNEAARVMKEMLLIQICCIAGVVVDRVTYNLIVNSKYLKLLHGQNDDDHPVSVPYYFSRWDADCSTTFLFWFQKWFVRKNFEVQERSRSRVSLEGVGHWSGFWNHDAAFHECSSTPQAMAVKRLCCVIPNERKWRDNVQQWHKHLRNLMKMKAQFPPHDCRDPTLAPKWMWIQLPVMWLN